MLITKIYENLQKVLEKFWIIYQKNMDNTVSHQRIYHRLKLLLQDKTQSDKVVSKINKLINAHEKFTTELKIEYEECQGIIHHGFPSVVDDTGMIKDKGQLIFEYKSLLSASLNISHVDTLDMTEIGEQLENFVTSEKVVRDIVFNACTYKV